MDNKTDKPFDNVIPLGTTGKPKAGRRKVKAGDPLTAKQMKFAEGLAAGLHFDRPASPVTPASDRATRPAGSPTRARRT